MTTTDERDDLIGQLISASLSMTHDTTNRLIDSLTEQLADSHAEVDAIRARIADLLNGPYQPSADAIIAALYPNAETRADFRRDLDAA